VGATIVVQDIDDEHRATEERTRHEEHRTLLINELNHRVKNMLATVQAVAIQTFTGARANSEGIEAFQSRLFALASAHDVLTRENWQSAFVREVIDGAIAPHCEKTHVPFDVGGPDVRLKPRAAIALAMALHELCTNAVKYGALSVPRGWVKIGWAVEDRDHAKHFKLLWKEYGGPRVNEPRRKGFGTRMIETALPQDFGASVALTYAPDGFECVIDAALGKEVYLGSESSDEKVQSQS
jgi:two-component sensor histidine kinase